MKNKIKFAGLGVIIVFMLYSCKKCVTCSNVCYRCDYRGMGVNVDTLCSEQSGAISGFNVVIQDMQTAGYKCTKLNPAQTYQYCDYNQNFVNALENSGFACQ